MVAAVTYQYTILGLLTQTSTTSANGLLAANPAQSSCTTVYQNFYVGAAVNIDPMIENAKQKGEYHYIGAWLLAWRWVLWLMPICNGELPVQEMGVGNKLD